jgi:hypothetical protein
MVDTPLAEVPPDRAVFALRFTYSHQLYPFADIIESVSSASLPEWRCSQCNVCAAAWDNQQPMQ